MFQDQEPGGRGRPLKNLYPVEEGALEEFAPVSSRGVLFLRVLDQGT